MNILKNIHYAMSETIFGGLCIALVAGSCGLVLGATAHNYF